MRRRASSFSVGDYVMMATRNLPIRSVSRKLAPRWVGPYRVLECVGPNAYRLDLPSVLRAVHPVVNVS